LSFRLSGAFSRNGPPRQQISKVFVKSGKRGNRPPGGMYRPRNAEKAVK
jgi:hypothetical protein